MFHQVFTFYVIEKFKVKKLYFGLIKKKIHFGRIFIFLFLKKIPQLHVTLLIFNIF